MNFSSLKLSSKDFLSDEEYICLLDLIINKIHLIENFLEIKNIKLICQKLPLFSLFFNNHFDIDISNQIDIIDFPIQNNDYDKNMIVKQIQMLLKMCQMSDGSDNKIIILIILYDFIMRNFKFVLDNKKFGETCLKKINEIAINDIDKINIIIEKYKLDSKIIDNWIAVFENVYL
jgi:hypothetical protein